MSGAPSGALQPRFSIVSAVYDVAPYLPQFIRSVERLRAGDDELEVVAVDDGSTDGSLDVLRGWARRSRFKVKVFTKPNGGQGSARNLGLEHATGEWVTFPDPDDVLERDYLGAAARFAATSSDVEVMSARPVLLTGARGERRHRHPRWWQYVGGSRVADLLDEPNVFLGVASGSFFRMARVTELGLRFDTRIRPNFEDAHFAARYLLDLPRPVIGLVPDSVYLYRKRAAGTSTLQRSMRHPGRYSVVPELGYLDIVERSRARDGSVPPWIQHLLVYELSWYLSESGGSGAPPDVPPQVLGRFHELLDRILAVLDPAVVAGHVARELRPAWRDVLAHGTENGWRSAVIVRGERDRTTGGRSHHYRYVGEPPSETVRRHGAAVPALAERTTAHRYLGRDFIRERTLVLPDVRDLEIELDGWPTPIATRWPGPDIDRIRGLGPTRRALARARRLLSRVARSRRRPMGTAAEPTFDSADGRAR